MGTKAQEFKYIELSGEDDPPTHYAAFLYNRTPEDDRPRGAYTIWANELGRQDLDEDLNDYADDFEMGFLKSDRREQDKAEARAWVERMKKRDTNIDIYLPEPQQGEPQGD